MIPDPTAVFGPAAAAHVSIAEERARKAFVLLTSDRKPAAYAKAGNDGIVRILLLSYRLDCAVKRPEQPAPDAKVAAQHRRAHLDGRQRADPPLAVRAVAEALDAVPDGAADSLRGGEGRMLAHVRP